MLKQKWQSKKQRAERQYRLWHRDGPEAPWEIMCTIPEERYRLSQAFIDDDPNIKVKRVRTYGEG